MIPANNDYKKPGSDEDDEGDSGQGSQIKFHDFMTGTERVLTPMEEKQLLSLHAIHHEANVKKQKNHIDNTKEIKNNPQQAKQGQYAKGQLGAIGGGKDSQFKQHPELANYSGADPETTPLPSDMDPNAEDNINERKEWSLTYQKQHQHEATPAPRFNPRPTPGGSGG